MKKLISIILLAVISLGFFPQVTFSSNEQSFVVTAYYSPLPNQQYYLRGNYEAEKRLNGQGIAGASGKKVFSGMLAAPKNYAFGTKIHLEGLGVGSVEDRGGAIVNAGDRGYKNDRIDVWMGYGDEGLRRALYWGKRTVKGTIINSQTPPSLDYTVIDSPFWVTNSLDKTPEIFSKSIGVKSSIDDIYELKEFLIYANFYEGELNGIYSNDLISVIYNFQEENNLVDKNYIESHGYWGKTTRTKIFELYKAGKLGENIILNQENNIDNKGDIFLSKNNLDEQKIKTEVYDVNDLMLINHNNIILKGDINYIFNNPVKTITQIAELQNILIELELYSGEVDGKYESIKESILEYQLVSGVINTKSDIGAGHYGPKTREMLYQDYIKLIEFNNSMKNIQITIDEKLEEYTTEVGQNVNKFDNINFGDISQSVRDFQLFLNDLGVFNEKDTAIFGEITKSAIIDLQLNLGVIESNTDLGAGIFGPNTQTAVIDFLANEKLQLYIASLDLDDEQIIELKKSDIILY